MGRTKVSPKRRELVLVALSFLFSMLAYWRDYDFPGRFLMLYGFLLMAFSFEKTLNVGGHSVRVRKRGAVFRVEVLRDGKRVWSRDIPDYAEFGDFAFDVRGGKVEIFYRGERAGTLP